VNKALDHVLWWAHVVSYEGPWWQEARAKHPLLAINVLSKTIKVRT
jgi:hypothetical protein